jgi:hypothetical protein
VVSTDYPNPWLDKIEVTIVRNASILEATFGRFGFILSSIIRRKSSNFQVIAF